MPDVSLNSMSLTHTTSTSSNFQLILDAALDQYTKRTGKDLFKHPLASIIEGCKSPDAILTIFQEQSRAFDEFRNGDPKLGNWLTPIVNRLHTVSTCAVLSAASIGASLAFPPAQLIFSGIGVLLSTAKYVRESYDSLVDIFECIENFTSRLKIYTEMLPTPAMTKTIINIMVELLAVLALTTKRINQGKLKKYAKKLLGESQVEAILQRLDRLTLEESKMTVAQILEVVHGLVNNMEIVMEGGKTSTDNIRQTLVLMHETVMKVNMMERDRLHRKLRRWLSPPDPWSNHNIAREAHHHGTATWFTQGDMFGKWKSIGSLLWVNGLPGSGKTIISSSIIEDIQDMCRIGLATLAIFYCDFRDSDKQDARNLLSSILIQFGHQSDAFAQILSSLYSTHGDGSREPSVAALVECLKTMFKLPWHGALYLVIDALDECPGSSGCPTPRERVLAIMQELIVLRLPHVHFCITSRPEIDIRDVLQALTVHNMPLHEQAGQNQDIFNYINYIVRSDIKMRKWREEDRQLVAETLTSRAGGMFRWVHCQVETLRFCFPPSIRRVLDELPETLDATYERTLLGINKQRRDYARCLFQCLVVAVRPLRIEELAELFTIQPHEDTSPWFNNDWRPVDPEEFILSACSTLVSIVNTDGEKVVQFSHFSVREYLTSDRIATSSTPVSHFHIPYKPAHALLARACLSVLLQLDYSIDEANLKIECFPLASYAAEHWGDHTRFEDVSSIRDIRDRMDRLFDRNKPHLDAWIWLYDPETNSRRRYLSPCPRQLDAVPLYYAALCGFHDLAGRLLDAYPQDLHARGGYHQTPLHAAVHEGHLNIVLLLLERGASVESKGPLGQTALYMASSCGYAEIVRALIDHGADQNTECEDWDKGPFDDVKWTPLVVASKSGRLEVAKVLLERGADVEYQDNLGRCPLHIASRYRTNDLVQLFIDHGANLDASDAEGATALHYASSEGQIAVVMSLIEHGASIDARDSFGWTPLHNASRGGHLEVVQELLDHGTDGNTPTKDRWTALHVAAASGRLQVVEALLQYDADPHALTDKNKTPFQMASQENHIQIAQLLSEHTGERMWCS